MHGNGDTRDALVDAALAGGASVIALAAGMAFASVRADPLSFVFVALVAFFAAFIPSLQAARGRKEEPT